ncbi:adenylate/guanylate cyclase domain-containing protein [Muriicola marianensis]|nr:adenylate/guanylate cyclase domain-containing protein [Muriicola marianensis]
MMSLFGHSQNQKITDSLVAVYESGDYEPEESLKLLRSIAYNNPDPEESLKYANLMLEKATEWDSTHAEFRAYLQRGNAYEAKGDLSQALDSYLNAADIVNELGDKIELGKLYIAIAGAYSGMENRTSVITYYTEAMNLLKDLDRENYATAIENFGDEYLKWDKPDSALTLFSESGPVFEALGNEENLAFNIGNKGLAYALKGEHKKGEDYIGQAIAKMEEIGNHRPICTYLIAMSDIYAKKNEWDDAFEYSLRALRLARELGLKAEIGNAYLKLSELYERTGYSRAALDYFRMHITYRDSVQNITEAQKMHNNQMARTQVAIDLLEQKERNQRIIVISTGIALFLIILLALSLYRRNRYIKKTNEIIEREKERSENLLLNILPEKTADELKKYGAVKADKLESVTVLFTDFLSFTKHSEQTDPELLVNTIGTYFTAFDDIVESYGLEKIKTIGDSYMCAGGLPEPLEDHALKMVQAAFDIMDFVEQRRANRKEGEPEFEMRVGINTGPVVAGVVGHNKFSYDIWGDTVNVAARMERLSEAGKINISESTYMLVRNHFKCEYRGEFEVKNKGMMKMYFVLGPLSEEKESRRSASILSS